MRQQFPLPFFAFLLLFSVVGVYSFALAREPLLQDGKKSVYQRVVTHPGAQLYASPDADAQVLRSDVTTFTVMYIYGRQGARLEVGVGSNHADGWIDSNMVTEWPQAITMLFTDRTGRAPVLFFRNHDALEQTCRAEDIAGELKSYAQSLSRGNLPPDFPVVATEPTTSAISEKNFYLLPVTGIDTQFYEQQGPRLIEVASINPGIGIVNGSNSSPLQGSQGRSQTIPSNAAELRTGFAFVIDTTISMKPYIDQTLKLVRTLYDELEKSPHADKMAFAVVAFRSSTKRTPGIEYTARVVCDFTTVKDRKRLEDALSGVKEATVSSHDINEDSFAGVKEAADSLSWQEYASRVMLMISDAGPLGAGDPDSLTGFSPEALADYLRTHKIYLTALHVKNPKSAKNHKYAADAYRTLTRQSDNQASYIAIDATSADKGTQAFERTAHVLAQSYEKVIQATAERRFIQPQQQKIIHPTPEDEARRIAESTGYAMQLQFWGNARGSTAPQVVRAWIADADLEKLAAAQGDAPVLAVEPAVLLTKGQLSNLYKQLKLLLQSSEQAFLNGNADLFAQILSCAAQMSRDPGQFSLHPDRNLAENGLLDEVLDDLPYKSVIGSMTRKDWEDMSTGQRDVFVKRIKSLLARYDAFDRDATHWESFGAQNPNDWVYRVPLSMLP
ncbi:MAG: VWA domain-containing protein [Desulfovibrio sp.]|nr:VWA domain-containing protein [Desulfovibrio sp.]